MRHRVILGLALFFGLGVQSMFARGQATDAQILANIQDKVYHADVFKHGEVTTTYANGVATLAGTVDNLGTKLAAGRAAQKVAGVSEVVNNIQVRVDDFTPRQMLEEARKEVVTYYAYGIFDNVQLKADGYRLIVIGQVTDPFKKSDLGNILASVRGVATLENNLEVLPVSNFDDSLRIRVARAIYGNGPLFIYGNRAVPPIHIIVKNGHVTLEGVVGSKLDKSLADMAVRNVGLSFSVVNNLHVERT